MILECLSSHRNSSSLHERASRVPQCSVLTGKPYRNILDLARSRGPSPAHARPCIGHVPLADRLIDVFALNFAGKQRRHLFLRIAANKVHCLWRTPKTKLAQARDWALNEEQQATPPHLAAANDASSLGVPDISSPCLPLRRFLEQICFGEGAPPLLASPPPHPADRQQTAASIRVCGTLVLHLTYYPGPELVAIGVSFRPQDKRTEPGSGEERQEIERGWPTWISTSPVATRSRAC